MSKDKLQVGMTVYLKPLNNAARRSTEIQKHKVVKIGRKYFETTSIEGNGRFTIQFFLNTFLQNANGYTSNYKVYLSEQEILDEHEATNISHKLRDIFAGSDLTLDKLRRIKAIVEE